MYAGAPYAGFPYAGGEAFGEGGGYVPEVPVVRNRLGGRRRGGYATVTVDVEASLPETFPGSGVPMQYPAPGEPAGTPGRLPSPGVEKAIAYPAPDVVDGWPR